MKGLNKTKMIITLSEYEYEMEIPDEVCLDLLKMRLEHMTPDYLKYWYTKTFKSIVQDQIETIRFGFDFEQYIFNSLHFREYAEKALKCIDVKSVDQDEWYTVGSAAKIAGVSVETWKEWNKPDPERYEYCEEEWEDIDQFDGDLSTLLKLAKKRSGKSISLK